MSATRPLRAAIVGCGRVSVFHVAALEELQDVELVAFCDLNEQQARARAAEAGVEAVYTDVETMLREIRPDVVHILTPPASHAALATTAAAYGAHMYVEKPLAPDADEAAAVVQAAREAGVGVCPGHSRLFDPPFLEARRRVDEGEIGRILSVRSEQGFTYEGSAHSAVIPWSYRYDWGIYDNLMPHPLSTACAFLDDPGEPVVIGFNTGCVREAAVEEIRALIPSAGAVAEVSLSLCNSPEVNRLELIGTRGRITVDFNTLTVVARSESGLPSAVTRFTGNFGTSMTLTSAGLRVAAGIATGKVKRYMGLRLLVAAFYRSLAEGTPPPILPEDGLLVARLMDQIKESCRSVAKPRVPDRPGIDSDSAARILVTGATGFLGGRFVERLAAEGAVVRATTRLMSRTKPLSNVEWVRCDLTSESEVRQALEGIETVYHCAAMTNAPGSLEEFEDANVAGTMRLLRGAQDAGVSHFVYVSSISVYGMPNGKPGLLDETLEYDARAGERGLYTQTKLSAEQELLDYIGDHQTPRVVVLRPGTLYGPGTSVPTGRFQLPSSNRRPVLAGGPRVPMPLTYVDNLIDAMVSAARSDVPSGSVYNVVDAEDLDQGQVSTTLRRVSGGRIRPVFLPYPIAWTMMLAFDVLSLARKGTLGTARFRLKRTLADMRFDSSAAERDLDWRPEVLLDEGLSRALERSRSD